MAVAVEAAMEERNRARSPKSAAATKAKLSSILKEISTSLFEKYEPVVVGEDWRYDGKLSFGKAPSLRRRSDSLLRIREIRTFDPGLSVSPCSHS